VKVGEDLSRRPAERGCHAVGDLPEHHDARHGEVDRSRRPEPLHRS
jgi:hypothetical protein